MQFFQHLQATGHPESVYHLISWNYMPPSGSSLIHPHLQVFASCMAPNRLRETLEAARKYTQTNASNYWDDLLEAEESRGERFLGKIGRTAWLSVYAPLGVAGDVMAIVKGTCCTLELTDNDLLDLATGLTRLMAAYDGLGIYSFNMSFFTGASTDAHARFHLLFSPRTYFNPVLGTPDAAALKSMYHESVCMDFPEKIAEILRSEF
jgi:galactose-1-phosphate uridylyltransferase